MRNRLYLYVLPVLAIVACKEALPLVDGGDPEGDAQTPEQDASSLVDGALADTASPDASSDASAPQDGGGDALDASADAYVAPSEDGGVVMGDVWLVGFEQGSWSVPADGGGLRKCAADASADPDGCCLVPIPRLEGGNLARVRLDLATGLLTIGGRTLPTLQVSEKDAGYFEGKVFPSTFATVPVALDALSTTGSPADRTEVAAFFNQPNLYGSISTSGTVVFASWDRTTQKLIVRSGHMPQWSNGGCRTNGNASFQSR
jgi:hypothetical protein